MAVYERSSISGSSGMASNSPTFCQVVVLNCQYLTHQSPRPKAQNITCHDNNQVHKGELFAHHNIHVETQMEVYERSIAAADWVLLLQTVPLHFLT
jgi:hypothetical protein